MTGLVLTPMASIVIQAQAGIQNQIHGSTAFDALDTPPARE